MDDRVLGEADLPTRQVRDALDATISSRDDGDKRNIGDADMAHHAQIAALLVHDQCADQICLETVDFTSNDRILGRLAAQEIHDLDHDAGFIEVTRILGDVERQHIEHRQGAYPQVGTRHLILRGQRPRNQQEYEQYKTYHSQFH